MKPGVAGFSFSKALDRLNICLVYLILLEGLLIWMANYLLPPSQLGGVP